MDVEGTDSAQRGEGHAEFESKVNASMHQMSNEHVPLADFTLLFGAFRYPHLQHSRKGHRPLQCLVLFAVSLSHPFSEL